MQPGPPFPHQQPGRRPYPGQPDPTWQAAPGQPGPAWQSPQGQLGPAWQAPQPYPQPGFPGPPAPRGSRAGLIALIIVAVSVLLTGGGVAVFMIFGTPQTADQSPQPAPVQSAVAQPPVAPGRYRTAPIGCAQLDMPPYAFTDEFPVALDDNEYEEECLAVLGSQTSGGSAEITIERDLEPEGVSTARDALTAGGQPVSGTAFENPPNATYPSEFGGCLLEYVRSNEYVSADFRDLPGVTDLASCEQAALPYVQKLYTLIG
jgi:hypothetical protein